MSKCRPLVTRCLFVEHLSLPDGKASDDGVRKTLGGYCQRQRTSFAPHLVTRQECCMNWRATSTSSNVGTSTVLLVIGIHDIVWQAISCRMIFGAGSPLPIHGKTTTSPADLGTTEPRIGLFKVIRSPNGNCLGKVPSFGSTGNVSCRPMSYISWN